MPLHFATAQGFFYWHGPADSTDMTRSLIAAGFRALHSS